MEDLYFAHSQSLAKTAPSCVNVEWPMLGSYSHTALGTNGYEVASALRAAPAEIPEADIPGALPSSQKQVA